MPVADPSSGRTFIWIITCILFSSVLAGGGCLVAYMFLPESQVASWVPPLGVTLVSLPWAFWILTFLYRIFSRCFGYRIRVGIGEGEREGLGDGGNANAHGEPSVTPNGGIDRALSVASHESEMPLARSMAT
ncbi:hypothetical protein VNO77_09947 [Canavalia gladiata]|uniref:Uncharacterized protein n=1 Tax=Canavalia gladiata TaxID=3824 RepID=A0AAN9MDI8_CANGL